MEKPNPPGGFVKGLCKIRSLSHGLKDARVLVFVIGFNMSLMQAHGGSTESSGLGDVFESHTNHLTISHSIFLRHWDRLIDLEAKEIEVLF